MAQPAVGLALACVSLALYAAPAASRVDTNACLAAPSAGTLPPIAEAGADRKCADSGAAGVSFALVVLAFAVLRHAPLRHALLGGIEGVGRADTPGPMEENPAPTDAPNRETAPHRSAARPTVRAEEKGADDEPPQAAPATPSRLVSSLNCEECGRDALRWSELIECGTCRRESCVNCTAWVDRWGLRFCCEECSVIYSPPVGVWLPDLSDSESDELLGPDEVFGPGSANFESFRDWERGS